MTATSCGRWFRLVSGVIFLILIHSPVAMASAYESSVVKIATSLQYPDFDAPWRRKPVKIEHYLATVVTERYLLVSARAVGYARAIEMTKFGESERFPLKVAFVDYVANLALLTPEHPDAMRGLKPLPLGQDPALQKNVSLLLRAKTDHLVAVPALVKNIALMQSGTANYSMSHLFLEGAQKTGLGWSEPVLVGGKLVGMTVGQDKDHLYALPVKIIRHFLKDFSHPPYKGFIRLGVSFAPLESPTLRAHLQVRAKTSGVVVTQIAKGSAFYGAIEPLDVLLKISETKITASGYYEHPVWGRTHFVDRLTDFFGGETLKLTVLRDGQEKILSAVVPRYRLSNDVIPVITYGAEPYLIFGGLILQQLDEGFLSTWGVEWRKRAPYQFLYQWSYANGLAANENERLVVMNRILSDQLNKGYEGRDNQVLEKVNGQAVHSLQDVAKALERPIIRAGQKLALFEFQFQGGPIVIAYEGLETARKRLIEKYDIPMNASFWQSGSVDISSQGATTQ